MSINEENVSYVNNSRILFIDPSSSCLGFAIFQVDYNRKSAEITTAGPLWFGSDWSEGKKLRFIFGCREYWMILNEGCSEIVCEDYFFPLGKHAKVQGSLVVPGIIGVMCLMAADEDPSLDFTKISAQQWRKQLNIKPDVSEHPTEKDNKGNPKKIKDFKTPVERYVKSIINLPTEFQSNITGKMRQTPNDVTDVIAMGMAVLQLRGIKKFTTQDNWFKKHNGMGCIGKMK